MINGQSTSLPLFPNARRERIRLLVVATLLPALCVLTSHQVFRFVESTYTFASVVLLFAFLTGQIAILGYAAGGWISHPVWRWLTFGWSVVLVNLLVFASRVPESRDWFQLVNPARTLRVSFVSAQVGFLTVWSVMSTVHWGWRAPALVVAFCLMIGLTWIMQFVEPRSSWLSVFSYQCLATLSLCLLLRFFRYRLEFAHPAETSDETAESEPILGQHVRAIVAHAIPQGPRLQFTILHLFTWMTVVAILLQVVPFVWQIISLENSRVSETTRIMAISGSLTIVTLTAVWAAIGTGKLVTRFCVLMGVMILAGFLLSLLLTWFEIRTWHPKQGAAYWKKHFFEDAQLWIVWTCLAGSFLTSLLLFLRASGYRLQFHPQRWSRIRYYLAHRPRNPFTSDAQSETIPDNFPDVTP